MKQFKFRSYVGPTCVNEVAGRLRDRGVKANAGTEHIYGTVEALNQYNAMDLINAIVGWQVMPSTMFLKEVVDETSA